MAHLQTSAAKQVQYDPCPSPSGRGRDEAALAGVTTHVKISFPRRSFYAAAVRSTAKPPPPLRGGDRGWGSFGRSHKNSPQKICEKDTADSLDKFGKMWYNNEDCSGKGNPLFGKQERPILACHTAGEIQKEVQQTWQS